MRRHTDACAESAASQLAGEIRRLRKAAGLSHTQVAAAIGYSRQYISLAERPGHNLPSDELVRALESLLQAGGVLLALRERAKKEQLALRRGPRAGGRRAEQRTDAAIAQRGQQEWSRVRKAPGARGRELSDLAAWLYPQRLRAPGGHVLTAPGWLLDEPVELGRCASCGPTSSHQPGECHRGITCCR
ncbi:helix-turn-helix domain-containing protein [Pseudonocardia sp.]|jgi:transcriptional regulator with XRE-family HTH domain|uniref:helix-turn-helix domain-containing protein n=1 Tax=Pseudonocardia sp. TaxID=60912 RepID=UPI0039C96FA9